MGGDEGQVTNASRGLKSPKEEKIMKSNNKVDPNDTKSNSNIDYVESAYLKDFNGVSSSLSSGNGIF